MPEEGDFFIGLPLVSGINTHVSSKLSYNEIFVKSDNSNPTLSPTKALSNMTRFNGMHTHFNFSLFHFGYRLINQSSIISAFANERVELDLLFPRDLVDYFWSGNLNYLEKDINEGSVAFRASHWREIGIGFAHDLPNQRLKFGLRGKYLQGMFNASLPSSFKGQIMTENSNYQLNSEWENAILRTSGLGIAQGTDGNLGTHLINNNNKGFAIDLGLQYEINSFYSLAFSLNDLGFINWNENIKTYQLNDTTFRFEGFQLKDAENIIDSLNSLKDRFNINNDNIEAYNEFLPTKMYGSFMCNYRGFDFMASTGIRLLQGNPRFSFGIGGRREFGKHLQLSANITKLDQQFFNVGAALMTRAAFFQFYLASDVIANFNVPDISALDLKIGINFLWENKSKQVNVVNGNKTKAKGSSLFLGQRVKLKGIDGIYSLIPRQKRKNHVNTVAKRPTYGKKNKTNTSKILGLPLESPVPNKSKNVKFKKKNNKTKKSRQPKFVKSNNKNIKSARPKFKKNKKKK